MSFSQKLAPERKFEIVGVVVLTITALLFLALATDGYQGDARRTLSELNQVPNAMGQLGAAIAGVLYMLFGQAAHVLYFVTFIWGVMLLRHQPLDRLPTRVVGFVLVAASIAGIMHIDFAIPEDRVYTGGAVGTFVATLVTPTFEVVGSNVILIAISVIGVLLATEFLFVRLVHTLVVGFLLVVRSISEVRYHMESLTNRYRALRGEAIKYRDMASEERRKRRRPATDRVTREKRGERDAIDTTAEEVAPAKDTRDDLSRIRIAAPEPQELPFDSPPADEADDDAPEIEPDVDDIYAASEAEREARELAESLAESAAPATPPTPSRPSAEDRKPKLRRKTFVEDELPADYVYPKRYTRPSLDMLESAPKIVRTDLTETLRQTGALLEETLQTFNIEARVTDVTRGPTITRFELEPAPGVKVSRFMALADDLALALKAHRVRVEAPIPGKGRVGIEVPNDEREAVVIRELLESRPFQKSSGALTLALGKGISGDVVAADLATMPHLLVAGATGAGKTVCVKTVLASLLFTKSPEELQLMLIDPKMVELSIFNDIPHLITPVVIDPKKAASSLNWLINEMEERYRLFAHLRVRNIEVYNQSVDNGEIEMSEMEGADAESLSVIRKLPYIVCIIDELADLMMLARAEVEDAIARLAQLARAVGIHLIIATQRPSVDVLTGVIKANFPARVSFQVSSRVDSRCILDEIGAERLIGRGDMLYLPPGQSKPTRIQAAFVSDDEMNSLIAYLKTQAPPQYRDEIENFGKKQEQLDGLADEEDDLLDDAVRVVLETGQASISMVQRRLRVGYTRAARLIDMMEMRGIVGPHIGSKAREILVPVSTDD